MKLLTRIAAVLAALALAPPALACPACADKADKTVEAKATPRQTVAKSDRQQRKSSPQAKRTSEAKPAPAATAAN